MLPRSNARIALQQGRIRQPPMRRAGDGQRPSQFSAQAMSPLPKHLRSDQRDTAFSDVEMLPVFLRVNAGGETVRDAAVFVDHSTFERHVTTDRNIGQYY